MEAIIKRFETSIHGTFGLLTIDNFKCFTLELPDYNNTQSISCIPQGEYEVSLRYSPSFKKTLYNVKNVPKRSFILIHGANFAGDKEKGLQSHLEGCIALGYKKGSAVNKFGIQQKCIFQSQQALNDFMRLLDKQDFTLRIINEYSH